MSVQALGWVFDHSPTKGTDRLVLLSIANYAGKNPENGAWESWPGVATIQREAGLDRKRTVMDALARLTAEGNVERIINGAPDERIRKDHRPNLYRILLDNGETCDDARCGWCGETPQDERGDASTLNGETADGATGSRDASPEPLLEPLGKPSIEPNPVAVVFDAWKEATGKSKVVLDAKRRGKIEKALKLGYPVEDLVDAVRGWKWSPFHCGQNDQRKTYNDLELLLRDAGKIEQFRDYERGIDRPSAGGKAAQRDDNNLAAARAFLEAPTEPRGIGS